MIQTEIIIKNRKNTVKKTNPKTNIIISVFLLCFWNAMFSENSLEIIS